VIVRHEVRYPNAQPHQDGRIGQIEGSTDRHIRHADDQTNGRGTRPLEAFRVRDLE
jgi:hypothetical protein